MIHERLEKNENSKDRKIEIYARFQIIVEQTFLRAANILPGGIVEKSVYRVFDEQKTIEIFRNGRYERRA